MSAHCLQERTVLWMMVETSMPVSQLQSVRGMLDALAVDDLALSLITNEIGDMI